MRTLTSTPFLLLIAFTLGLLPKSVAGAELPLFSDQGGTGWFGSWSSGPDGSVIAVTSDYALDYKSADDWAYLDRSSGIWYFAGGNSQTESPYNWSEFPPIVINQRDPSTSIDPYVNASGSSSGFIYGGHAKLPPSTPYKPSPGFQPIGSQDAANLIDMGLERSRIDGLNSLADSRYERQTARDSLAARYTNSRTLPAGWSHSFGPSSYNGPGSPQTQPSGPPVKTLGSGAPKLTGAQFGQLASSLAGTVLPRKVAQARYIQNAFKMARYNMQLRLQTARRDLAAREGLAGAFLQWTHVLKRAMSGGEAAGKSLASPEGRSWQADLATAQEALLHEMNAAGMSEQAQVAVAVIAGKLRNGTEVRATGHMAQFFSNAVQARAPDPGAAATASAAALLMIAPERFLTEASWGSMQGAHSGSSTSIGASLIRQALGASTAASAGATYWRNNIGRLPFTQDSLADATLKPMADSLWIRGADGLVSKDAQVAQSALIAGMLTFEHALTVYGENGALGPAGAYFQGDLAKIADTYYQLGQLHLAMAGENGNGGQASELAGAAAKSGLGAQAILRAQSALERGDIEGARQELASGAISAAPQATDLAMTLGAASIVPSSRSDATSLRGKNGAYGFNDVLRKMSSDLEEYLDDVGGLSSAERANYARQVASSSLAVWIGPTKAVTQAELNAIAIALEQAGTQGQSFDNAVAIFHQMMKNAARLPIPRGLFSSGALGRVDGEFAALSEKEIEQAAMLGFPASLDHKFRQTQAGAAILGSYRGAKDVYGGSSQDFVPRMADSGSAYAQSVKFAHVAGRLDAVFSGSLAAFAAEVSKTPVLRTLVQQALARLNAGEVRQAREELISAMQIGMNENPAAALSLGALALVSPGNPIHAAGGALDFVPSMERLREGFKLTFADLQRQPQYITAHRQMTDAAAEYQRIPGNIKAHAAYLAAVATYLELVRSSAWMLDAASLPQAYAQLWALPGNLSQAQVLKQHLATYQGVGASGFAQGELRKLIARQLLGITLSPSQAVALAVPGVAALDGTLQAAGFSEAQVSTLLAAGLIADLPTLVEYDALAPAGPGVPCVGLGSGCITLQGLATSSKFALAYKRTANARDQYLNTISYSSGFAAFFKGLFNQSKVKTAQNAYFAALNDLHDTVDAVNPRLTRDARDFAIQTILGMSHSTSAVVTTTTASLIRGTDKSLAYVGSIEAFTHTALAAAGVYYATRSKNPHAMAVAAAGLAYAAEEDKAIADALIASSNAKTFVEYYANRSDGIHARARRSALFTFVVVEGFYGLVKLGPAVLKDPAKLLAYQKSLNAAAIALGYGPVSYELIRSVFELVSAETAAQRTAAHQALARVGIDAATMINVQGILRRLNVIQQPIVPPFAEPPVRVIPHPEAVVESDAIATQLAPFLAALKSSGGSSTPAVEAAKSQLLAQLKANGWPDLAIAKLRQMPNQLMGELMTYGGLRLNIIMQDVLMRSDAIRRIEEVRDGKITPSTINQYLDHLIAMTADEIFLGNVDNPSTRITGATVKKTSTQGHDTRVYEVTWQGQTFFFRPMFEGDPIAGGVMQLRETRLLMGAVELAITMRRPALVPHTGVVELKIGGNIVLGTLSNKVQGTIGYGGIWNALPHKVEEAQVLTYIGRNTDMHVNNYSVNRTTNQFEIFDWSRSFGHKDDGVTPPEGLINYDLGYRLPSSISQRLHDDAVHLLNHLDDLTSLSPIEVIAVRLRLLEVLKLPVRTNDMSRASTTQPIQLAA